MKASIYNYRPLNKKHLVSSRFIFRILWWVIAERDMYPIIQICTRIQILRSYYARFLYYCKWISKQKQIPTRPADSHALLSRVRISLVPYIVPQSITQSNPSPGAVCSRLWRKSIFGVCRGVLRHKRSRSLETENTKINQRIIIVCFMGSYIRLKRQWIED